MNPGDLYERVVALGLCERAREERETLEAACLSCMGVYGYIGAQAMADVLTPSPTPPA